MPLFWKSSPILAHHPTAMYAVDPHALLSLMGHAQKTWWTE